jgi:hypothetical protein
MQTMHMDRFRIAPLMGEIIRINAHEVDRIQRDEFVALIPILQSWSLIRSAWFVLIPELWLQGTCSDFNTYLTRRWVAKK